MKKGYFLKAVQLSQEKGKPLADLVAAGLSPMASESLMGICLNPECTFTAVVPERTTDRYCPVCKEASVTDVLTLCSINEKSTANMFSVKAKYR